MLPYKTSGAPTQSDRRPTVGAVLQRGSFCTRNSQPRQGRWVKEGGKKEGKGDACSNATSQRARTEVLPTTHPSPTDGSGGHRRLGHVGRLMSGPQHTPS